MKITLALILLLGADGVAQADSHNDGSYLAMIGIAKTPEDEGERSCGLTIPDLVEMYGKVAMFVVGFDGNIRVWRDAASDPKLIHTLPISRRTNKVVVGVRRKSREAMTVRISVVKPDAETSVMLLVEGQSCKSRWTFPAVRTAGKK